MNPYHDPKTGRFTTANRSGAGLTRAIKGPRVKGTIPTGKGPKYKEQKGGEMTKTLRKGMQQLHKKEQDRIYSFGGNVVGSRVTRTNLRKAGDKIKAQAKSSNFKADPNTKLSDILRGNLRQLAQSDARYYRSMDKALKEARPNNGPMIGSTKIPKTRRLKGK